MAPTRSASIRLGTTGGAQVKAELGDIRQAGNLAFTSIGKSADESSAALQRNADRIKSVNDALANTKAKQAAILATSETPANANSPTNSNVPVVSYSDKRFAAGILAQIDPVAVAEESYARAIKRADDALKANLITEKQHAAFLTVSKRALDDVVKSQHQHADAAGLSANQLKMMAIQLPDVIQGLLGGQSVFQVFVQQGGQVAQIAGMGPGGMGGAFKALGSLITPTVAGIAAITGAVAVGAIAAVKYSDAQDQFALSLMGIGRATGATAGGLEHLAETQAAVAGISVAAARDQEVAYIRMGITNTDVIGRMIAISRDYALVTGQDAKVANESLAKAMADPAGAGLEVLRSLGLLDSKTREYIVSLERQGQHEAAQEVLLGKYSVAVDGARQHVNDLSSALDFLGRKGSEVFSSIGKELSRPFRNDPQSVIDNYLHVNSGNAEGYGIFGGIGRTQYLKAIQDKKAMDDLAAKNEAAAKSNILDLRSSDALNALDPVSSQRKVIEDNLAAVKAGLDAGKRSQEEYNKALTGAKRQRDALDKKDNPTAPGASRAATLAREAESMGVNTKASLALAAAYLDSDAAAFKAEASRTALTRATKQGADTESAVRRQIALNIAEQAVAGARNVAALRDQTDAQKTVNDAVAAGTISAKQAAVALQLQSQLQPLITAQTNADADAKATLAETIDKLTVGLTALNNEQGRAQLLAASDADRDQIASLRVQLDLIGKTNSERAIAIAQFKVQQDIQKALPNLDVNDPNADFAAAVDRSVSSDVTAAREAYQDKAKYLKQAGESLDDDIARSQLELSLLGKTQAARDAALAQFDIELNAKRSIGTLTAEELAALKQKQSAQSAMNAELERAKAAQAEITDLQNSAFDSLEGYLNAGKFSWKSLGDVATDVLKDIMASLIRMEVINPFKNWALGQDNPTGGDIKGGFLQGVFKLAGIGGFARGTENAPDGWAWVGEDGPELMKLRAGDIIRNNPDSLRMTAETPGSRLSYGGQKLGAPIPMRIANPSAVNKVNNTVQNFDLRGAWVDKDVWAEVDKRAAKVAGDINQASNEAMLNQLPDEIEKFNRDPRVRKS